jgi:hypothetical protein
MRSGLVLPVGRAAEYVAGSHGRTTKTVFPGRRGAGGGP